MKKILISNYTEAAITTLIKSSASAPGYLGESFKPIGPYQGHWENYVSSCGIALLPITPLTMPTDPEKPSTSKKVFLKGNYSVEVNGKMIPTIFSSGGLGLEFTEDKKRGVIFTFVKQDPDGTDIYTIDSMDSEKDTLVRIFGLDKTSIVATDETSEGSPVEVYGPYLQYGGVGLFPAKKVVPPISCVGATNWFGVNPGLWADKDDAYEVRSGAQNTTYDIFDAAGNLLITSNEFEPSVVGVDQDDYLGEYVIPTGSYITLYTFKNDNGILKPFNFDQLLKPDGTFWTNNGNQIDFVGVEGTFNYNQLISGPDSKTTPGAASWDGDIWYSEINFTNQAMGEEFKWAYTLNAALGLTAKAFNVKPPYSRYKLPEGVDELRFSITAKPELSEYLQIPDINPAVMRDGNTIRVCLRKADVVADPTSKFAVSPGLYFGTEGSFDNPFRGDPVNYKVTNVTTGVVKEGPIFELSAFGFTSTMSAGLYTVPTDTTIDIYAYINVADTLQPYNLPCIQVAGTEGFKTPDGNKTVVPLMAGDYHSNDLRIMPTSKIITDNKDLSETNGYIIYSSKVLNELDPNGIGALNYTLMSSLKPFMIEEPYFIHSAKRGSPVEEYKIETTYPLAKVKAVTDLNPTTKINGQVITFSTKGEEEIVIACEGALDRFRFEPDLPIYVGGTIERPIMETMANYIVTNPETDEILSEGPVIDIPGFETTYNFGEWAWGVAGSKTYDLYSYSLGADGETLTPTNTDLINLPNSVTEWYPRAGNKHNLTLVDLNIDFRDFSASYGSKLYANVVHLDPATGNMVVWSDKEITKLDKPRIDYDIRWTLLPMVMANKVYDPYATYVVDPMNYNANVKLAIAGIPLATDIGDGAVVRKGNDVLICLQPAGHVEMSPTASNRLDPKPDFYPTAGRQVSWIDPQAGGKMWYKSYFETNSPINQTNVFDPEDFGMVEVKDPGLTEYRFETPAEIFVYTRDTPTSPLVPYTGTDVFTYSNWIPKPIIQGNKWTFSGVYENEIPIDKLYGAPEAYLYTSYKRYAESGKELVYLGKEVNDGYVTNAANLSPDLVINEKIAGSIKRAPGTTYFLKEGNAGGKYRLNRSSEIELSPVTFEENENVKQIGDTISLNLAPWVPPAIDPANAQATYVGIGIVGAVRISINGKIIKEVAVADEDFYSIVDEVEGDEIIINCMPVMDMETGEFLGPKNLEDVGKYYYLNAMFSDENKDRVITLTFEAIGNSYLEMRSVPPPGMSFTPQVAHMVFTNMDYDTIGMCPANPDRSQELIIDDSEVDEWSSGFFIQYNGSYAFWCKDTEALNRTLNDFSLRVTVTD